VGAWRTVVSAELDKARALIEVGKDKRALWVLNQGVPRARTKKDEAQALLELALVIRDRNGGRVRRDAESVVGRAEAYLDRIANPPVAQLAALYGCRVSWCQGFEVSSGTKLDLLLATDGVLLRGRDRDRRELARLDYSEIDKMELGEVSQPTSGKRRAGEAALGVSIGVLSGLLGGDSKRGRSTAGEMLESHTVDVTLITSRGRITLLHESPDKLKEVRSRLAPGLERIKAAGPG
jgi:hypothetical protein